MLWNWNTVDSCFLSSTWHIRSKGMFAGSVIGVFLLVIAIEAVRRGAREYDRYISRKALAATSPLAAAPGEAGTSSPGVGGVAKGAIASSPYDAACAPQP
jgi:copper transporter 1